MENKNHTMRRILSCVAVVVMMLTAVLFIGATGKNSSEWLSPFELQARAYWENGLTYTVSDGKATITDCSSSISGDLVIPEVLGGYPVTSIGSNAFRSCTGLTNVTILDSVTSIGDCAFLNCVGLTTVTIGNSVSSIGYEAFDGCTGLTQINWNAESVTDFDQYDYVFFNAGISEDGIDVIFGDNVKSIPKFAFYISSSSCRPNIKSVTISNSITRIGGGAFYGCTSLTRVNIINLASWCKIAFDNNYSNPLYYAKKLFINGNLATNILIPDSVTSIGNYAFFNCVSLTSVTISNRVTRIGYEAFCGCTGLTQINWNAESVSDFVYGHNAFCNAGSAGTGIEVVFSDNVKSIPAQAFYVYNSPHRANIKSVTIGNNVESIGEFAFYGCAGLTNIVVPDSVTRIGDYAFGYCSGLTGIVMPNSVTSIGSCVFSNCNALEVIKFDGKPPIFSNSTFNGYNQIVLYPYGISEWKSAIKSKYGGWLTWVCYSNGTLTDLKIKSLPNKVVYYQGEKANYSGLSLTGMWSDGFSAVITPDSKIYDISISGFSTKKPGIKTVTATLDGKSVQFKLGVHKISGFTEEKSKYPESVHNYADNLNEIKTYKCPDAIKLVVTFSDKTFVEKDGDYIYVNGAKYTGDQLAGKKVTINGDTLTVKLVSDDYGNYYGYSIDKIEVTKIEHTYKTATTKATAAKDGKTVTACSVCGKVSKTTPIYKASSIKLSAASFTYNAKVQRPTVTVKNSKGTTLKNGTDYTVAYSSGCKNPGKYAVKVTFKGNYSGSKTLYFTILPGVTSSIATATNSSAIKLTWKAVPGATGYRVFQYDAKTKKYVTVKTLTGTSYTVSKLKSGTTYKFAVRAYSTVNGTVYWASGYKTVTATTNPGTPTLSVTAGAKKATLKWTKRAEATGYVVYMATSKTGKYTKIATIKNNGTVSMTKTGLTTGKTYYFKVASYKIVSNSVIYSGWSAVKSVKIK